MTAFFEDRDGILAKNGVLLPPEADPAPSDKSQITCRICDDPIPIQSTQGHSVRCLLFRSISGTII